MEHPRGQYFLEVQQYPEFSTAKPQVLPKELKGNCLLCPSAIYCRIQLYHLGPVSQERCW